LAGASAFTITLDVRLHSAHIEDVSSVPLCGGAASIENVFPPHKSPDRYSDHENQGESDANEDCLAASHAN
jgi:hypothetical protein